MHAPQIGAIVGRNLLKANWQKSASHLSSMANRGWASLWPSKLNCPTAAALHQMQNADLLERLAAKKIEFSAAVEESLLWDPLTEDTLLLFEAGHFWERVIADALLEEYGGSRNVRIEDEKGRVAGEIDVLTPGPNGTFVAYEIKSTRQWGMDNYGPSNSHIVQLAIYKHLWNMQSPKKHDIDDAYLIYTPNDKHPSTVLRKMKTIHLGDALRDAGLSHEQVVTRLALAQQYIREAALDDPPPPFLTGETWPCSKKNGSVPVCPFYKKCFPVGPSTKVWDIPF